jgi:hypothetical protein
MAARVVEERILSTSIEEDGEASLLIRCDKLAGGEGF